MYADARLKETATPCATVIASYCSSDYDTASLLSRSPDSSPAGASDNGIETGSDDSSSRGDAAVHRRTRRDCDSVSARPTTTAIADFVRLLVATVASSAASTRCLDRFSFVSATQFDADRRNSSSRWTWLTSVRARNTSTLAGRPCSPRRQRMNIVLPTLRQLSRPAFNRTQRDSTSHLHTSRTVSERIRE